MHRTDGTDHVSNMFSDGDPGVPRLGTVIEEDWLNAIQEELIAILTAGGVTPVKGTNTQVLEALRNILVPRNANDADQITEAGRQRIVFRKTGTGGAGANGTTEIWITINASWNGSAWAKDHQPANALAICLLSSYQFSGPAWLGTFALLRQTANVATFADTDWTASIFTKSAPTFTAAKWINTGGSTRALKVWSDPFGVTCMEGEVSNDAGGAPTDPITTLAAGFRPPSDMTFVSSYLSGGNRTFCTIKITSAGVVTTDAGTGAAVSFANVRFTTAA